MLHMAGLHMASGARLQTCRRAPLEVSVLYHTSLLPFSLFQ